MYKFVVEPRDFQSEHLNAKSVVCYLSSLYLGMVEAQSVDNLKRRHESLATTSSLSQIQEQATAQHSPSSTTKRQIQHEHTETPPAKLSSENKATKLNLVTAHLLTALRCKNLGRTAPFPVDCHFSHTNNSDPALCISK